MIDAIEEGVARLEVDGERVVTLPAWILPADAVEGDVLRVEHDREGDRSRLVVTRDDDATRLAYESSGQQMQSMREAGGDGGGDITL